MPFDNVDDDYLKIPRHWEAASIKKFMLIIGPTSSIFDITTYLMMFFVIGPQVFHGSYATLSSSAQLAFAALFQAGWFVESQWTQTIVIHSLRTKHLPFVQSNASLPVYLLTSIGILVSTGLAIFLGFGSGPQPLGFTYFAYLAGVIMLYSLLVMVVKKYFVSKYGELL